MNTMNFVKLNGTEKQVKWAESIRNSFFENVPAANEKAEQIMTDIVNMKTDAKFWIEEIQNKAVIGIIEVLMKCADFATEEELQKYMISKMN